MKKFITLVMAVAMLASLAVTTSAAEMPADYLAYLTFDSEDSLASGDVTVNVNNPAADGSAAVVLEDGHNGSAITFDSTDDTTKYWLELTKADGTSLLAGLNEVTISWWSNSDLAGPNWTFFATRNVDGAPIEQTYLSEKYIGALENSALTCERYNLEGADARTTALQGSLWGDGWQMFTIVYTDTSFTLYQDGEFWTTYDACEGNTLPEILTDDHSFLIGAATWGGLGNEAFTGQIDDFVIYPYALTEEQVADLCVAQGGEVEIIEDTEAPADDTTAAPVEDDTTAAPAEDTNAPADDTTAAPAEEKSGCGSSMGAAAIVALVATLGCAVVKKH